MPPVCRASKEDLVALSRRLGLRLGVAHYPPFHGGNRYTVRSQIWIAFSVYVLVAGVQPRQDPHCPAPSGQPALQ
jgi:hypothetical protein